MEKIRQEQIFAFLKEELVKAAGEKAPELERFFDRLDAANTVGDLRKIVEEFPIETAIRAADALTVYEQWIRIADRDSGSYAKAVYKKLQNAAVARRKERRCLI